MRNAEDAAAWGQFVEIYTPLIFGFCRGRGLQEADAADVAQEVMRAVSRSMGWFDYNPEQGTFRSWLFTVTRNKFYNFLERRRNHREADGGTTMQQLIEARPCPEQDESWDREYHQWLFDWRVRRFTASFRKERGRPSGEQRSPRNLAKKSRRRWV